LEIDVEDQIKGIDKEILIVSRGDLIESLCKNVNKVKPNDGVPTEGTTRRSTRPKNLKFAKQDDYLWEN
jgi:hypothetical protein